MVNADELLAFWEEHGVRVTRRGGRVVGLDFHAWGSHCDDAALASLGAFPQTEVLVLAQTAVTDAGLAPLAELGRLQQLDLQHTAITDAGLEFLAGLKSLKLLLLTGARVTRDGVRTLRPRMIGTRIVCA